MSDAVRFRRGIAETTIPEQLEEAEEVVAELERLAASALADAERAADARYYDPEGSWSEFMDAIDRGDLVAG